VDKLSVRDLDAAGKRVLVRVDFNVPIEDGKVKDDSRIRAAIPTIALLLEKGAAVILASHLGRPKGKVVESYRLRPVAERLSQLLRGNVPVTGDALGVGTADALSRLKPGQVLLLENLRFHAEEEANDPGFARTLAGYADAYVNDAFGTAHRAHASTVGITEYLPAYAGLLMEREIDALSKLLESPEHPFAVVVGGAKVSDKVKVLDNFLKRVDTLVIGGGMANTFLVAMDHTVGKSLLERDMVDECRRILANARRRKVEIVLPTDVVVAKEVTRGAEHKVVPVAKVPNSWSIVDIGPESREAFERALEPARTIFWNGPLGVFEVPTFGDGTRAMARFLARKAQGGATVVVGGGDSVAALEQLGLSGAMTHISTGGGASLEFLEGRTLPGIAALLDRPRERVAPPRPAARRPAPVAPKSAPARQAAADRKPAPTTGKPAPAARKPAPVARKAARATKPAPARKATTAKTSTATRKASTAKKSTTAKQPATTRKSIVKKPTTVRKSTPAKTSTARKSTIKKSSPKKATTAKKPATARKSATKKSTPKEPTTARKRPSARAPRR
jgi:phosphoglycerate kinase